MASSKKQRVLLVDDDTLLLQLYTRKAEQYDIDFRAVQSADKALEEVRGGFVPDVFIVDIEMPVMDGFELLEQIKKEHLADDAFVLILTNKSEQEFIERAKELGVHEYIVKAMLLPAEVMNEVFRLLKTKEEQE